MKPHEYLRLMYSMRKMGTKQSVALLVNMPFDERKEMQLCMLELMRFMMDDIEEETQKNNSSMSEKVDDDFLKDLFKKSNIE